MNRKQLVLDAGGVLVADLTPDFWALAGDAAGRSFKEIKAAFKAELRDGFWSGDLPEAAFWRWLGAYCPGLPEQEARERLRRMLRPLPAFYRIPAWSALADVHVLSNHRAEWLAAVLEEMRPYLKHVVISSEVDDQQRNIAAAESAGWQGLLADAQGDWTVHADRWLAGSTDKQAR